MVSVGSGGEEGGRGRGRGGEGEERGNYRDRGGSVKETWLILVWRTGKMRAEGEVGTALRALRSGTGIFEFSRRMDFDMVTSCYVERVRDTTTIQRLGLNFSTLRQLSHFKSRRSSSTILPAMQDVEHVALQPE